MPQPHISASTRRRLLPVSLPAAMVLAALGVAVSTGFAFRLAPYLSHADLALIFLAGVLFISVGLGLWPSLFGSALSFFTYNFLFTEPYFTFQVEYRTDLVRLAVFLLVATVTGQLAARMRTAIEDTRAVARRTEALHDFSRRMAAVVSMEDAMEATVDHLAATLGRPAVLLAPARDGRLEQRAASSDDLHLAAGDLAHAQQLWQGRAPARGPWQFVRLETAGGPLAMAAIGTPLTADMMELAEGLCGQAAVAIERTQLADELQETRRAAETEQLRAALLSSLSHDLHAPLLAIHTITTELLTGEPTPPEHAAVQLREVRDQTDRLMRYLQSLFDMTRVGEGGQPLRRASVDLREIVVAALNRLHAPLEHFNVVLDLQDIAPAYVHAALIEQALVNVLDNATRYSPPGGTIAVRLHDGAERAHIEVVDQGPGFPAGQPPGLGLTIAHALVGAHAGDLEVLPGPEGRGTRVSITLPLTADAGQDGSVRRFD
ncbi:MAG: DUF4118 domain-containing protein [Thiohalomonadaceae bacterium]